MRGLWLEEKQLCLRDDLRIPVPSAGEALVRVLTAGICNTDIELTRGYYPFAGIPGHEFVGVVEKGPEDLLNRRVVGEINAACESCNACRAGRRTHCERRTVLGIRDRPGAFAEYLCLPTVNLHAVPDHVTTAQAVFTEPLAAALEIQQQVRIRPDDHVLVLGAGKLGQLVSQTLALTGCRLVVAGKHRDALGLLAERGIETVPPEAVASGQFDLAVDCTGSRDGFTLSRRALRARGTLVMKSTYAGDLTVNASSLVVDEITLIGSRCGPFAPALSLLAGGTVDVLPLIHATYSLDSIISAFERAQCPGVLKVLVTIGRDTSIV